MASYCFWPFLDGFSLKSISDRRLYMFYSTQNPSHLLQLSPIAIPCVDEHLITLTTAFYVSLDKPSG